MAMLRTHVREREREGGEDAKEKETQIQVYGNYRGKCQEIYPYIVPRRENSFKKHMTVNITRNSCSDYLCGLQSKRIAKGGW